MIFNDFNVYACVCVCVCVSVEFYEHLRVASKLTIQLAEEYLFKSLKYSSIFLLLHLLGFGFAMLTRKFALAVNFISESHENGWLDG